MNIYIPLYTESLCYIAVINNFVNQLYTSIKKKKIDIPWMAAIPQEEQEKANDCQHHNSGKQGREAPNCKTSSINL